MTYDVPADDLPAQPLDDELRRVAAAVVAHVRDEPLVGHREVEAAVELSPTGSHHVGHVQVAEATSRGLLHVRDTARDPGLVPQRRLAGRRDHGHPPTCLLYTSDAADEEDSVDL